MKNLWSWLAALTLLVIGGFIFRKEVGPTLHFLENAVKEAGTLGPVLFTIFFAIWVTLCLPGPMMLPVIGALFASRPIVAIACVSVADAIAQATAFLIAKHLAKDKVQNSLGEKAWFGWLQGQISERGFGAAFTIRLIPVFPNSLANYAFGVSNIAFGPYLVASWAGTLPSAVAYGGGAAGVVRLLKDGKSSHDVWLALGILAAIALLALLANRSKTAKQSRQTV
jgi:uncharacterized membrane protein YdjX (TVP38/TMEM64 family)